MNDLKPVAEDNLGLQQIVQNGAKPNVEPLGDLILPETPDPESESDKRTIEVAITENPGGIVVELDRDADYILVLSGSPHVTVDQAKRIGAALKQAIGRSIPVLVTEGQAQILRVPQSTANPSEPEMQVRVERDAI